jgi:hypothetical protein
MTQNESPGTSGDIPGTDPLQAVSGLAEGAAYARPSSSSPGLLEGEDGPLQGQGHPTGQGQGEFTQRILPLIDPLGPEAVNELPTTAAHYMPLVPSLSSPVGPASPSPGLASPVGLVLASRDGSEDMSTAPSLADSIAAALQANVTDLPTVSLPTSVSVASIEVLITYPGL